ncbi:MAG: hypothetical protein ORN26_02640 [Candidatus Pacebacteria bacterium]|nr:hypothetical protein [Candidatus Paceibacterota bacterium]
MAETMNREDATNNVQPDIKPIFIPKILLTQVNDAPALASIFDKCAKENATPSINIPQYRIVAGDKTPTATIRVLVAVSILNAGAVPAMPIAIEDHNPKVFSFKPLSLFILIFILLLIKCEKYFIIFAL